MLVYILLYVSICVFANMYSRKTVVKTFQGYKDIDCIPISFIIMALFLGLRNDIGLDDGMYLRTFQEIRSDGSSWRDIEASYTWISKIVQSVGGTVQLVFLIYAIITCFFLYLSIKKLVKNENRWIFFGIFLSFMFLSSITLMRQFAAGSLVLYGYCNWRENKWKKSIVILFMAGMLHTSAFLSILYFFLAKYVKKISSSTKMMILIFCYIFQYIPVSEILVKVVGAIPALSKFYYVKYYLLTSSRFFSDHIGIIETCYLLLFIYMMFTCKNARTSDIADERDSLFSELETYAFLYFAIRMLLSQFGYLYRISYYLEFFAVIYMSSCNCIFNKRSQRIFQAIGVTFFFLLFIYAVYSYRMQGSQYNPLIPYSMNLKLFE